MKTSNVYWLKAGKRRYSKHVHYLHGRSNGSYN